MSASGLKIGKNRSRTIQVFREIYSGLINYPNFIPFFVREHPDLAFSMGLFFRDPEIIEQFSEAHSNSDNPAYRLCADIAKDLIEERFPDMPMEQLEQSISPEDYERVLIRRNNRANAQFGKTRLSSLNLALQFDIDNLRAGDHDAIYAMVENPERYRRLMLESKVL
jgi:hypothetical protein